MALLVNGTANVFMRIEAGIALTVSTVLHAGIIFLAPDVPGTRDSAARAAMPPQIITAHLKNTLDDAEIASRGASRSARLARSARNQSAIAAARPVRVIAPGRRERRIENVLRFYPPEAIRQGLEGEAIVMLHIDGNGGVLAAEIAKSSGHVILDEAALRAVRATPRFPPGPREMLFPVTFALR